MVSGGGAAASAVPRAAGRAAPAGAVPLGVSAAPRPAAAAVATPAAAAGSGSRGVRPAAVSEASVATLTALGFGRAEAVQALVACGGNAELAANMLSQAKYGF